MDGRYLLLQYLHFLHPCRSIHGVSKKGKAKVCRILFMACGITGCGRYNAVKFVEGRLHAPETAAGEDEIGRASCRERV